MRFFAGPRLLIIDEVGYLPLQAEGAAALFQVITQRHFKGSIVLTTNLGIPSWGKIFDDPMVAAAMLDRLLHRSVVLNITGESYRMRAHRARADKLRSRGRRPPMTSTPVAGRHRDDHLPGLPARHFTPVGRQRYCSDRVPQDRVPAPPPGPARRRHRPGRPAPARPHHLRMPRLRAAPPRRAALPRLRHLRPPHRPRRPLPALRRARRHHRPARPGGGHHARQPLTSAQPAR